MLNERWDTTSFGVVSSWELQAILEKGGPVIPKTLKMGVVPACMVLMMKWGPQNISGRPSVSIM